MGNNLFEYFGVTIIFPAFDRWSIIHLNDICVAICIFYVDSVESPPDCIRCLNPKPDNMGGDLFWLYTFNPAVDKMPVDRGLDFERVRGYGILACIEQFPIQYPYAPVIPALDKLLDDNPVRE